MQLPEELNIYAISFVYMFCKMQKLGVLFLIGAILQQHHTYSKAASPKRVTVIFHFDTSGLCLIYFFISQDSKVILAQIYCQK